MKNISYLTFTIILIANNSVNAQGCYLNNLSTGKKEYNAGDYYKALEYFNNSCKCSDAGNCLEGKEWIEKCKNKLPTNKKNSEILLPVYNKSDKRGYVDRTGKLIVDYIYDDFSYWHNDDGYGIVGTQVGNKIYFGLINSSGATLLGVKYERLNYLNDDLFYYKLGNSEGVIDEKGNLIFNIHNPEKAQIDLHSFLDGVAVINKGKSTGIIDKNGSYTFPLQEEIDLTGYLNDGCHNGLFRANMKVGDKNKSGFVDKYGKTKIDFQYDDACSFSEGMAAVLVNGKWGFINTKGELVIKPQYDNRPNGFGLWDNGITVVGYNETFVGYIDKNGNNLFTDKSFTEATNFFNGLAVVNTIDNKTKIINSKGEYIYTLNFEAVLDMSLYSNNILVCHNGDFTHEYYVDVLNNKVIWQSETQQDFFPVFTCFAGVTEIVTKEGLSIPIKDVTPGMQVLSYNPQKRIIEYSKVLEIKIHSDTAYDLSKIYFTDINENYASASDKRYLLSIEGTPNHPVLTPGGLKTIGEITDKDKIMYFSSEKQGLIECQVLFVQKNSSSTNAVFNLKLENDNYYFANGIVASPKCPNLYLMYKGKYVFIDEIIKNQISVQSDHYDSIQIPVEMIEENKLKLRISEDKDEVSYLDHIYLKVGSKIILPEYDNNILENIRSNDQAYLSINKGDQIELTFLLSENTDRTSLIQLCVKGYYEPFLHSNN